MAYIYGLDISKHNGTLDFNAIKKAGNSFVIIRAGYGKDISQKDPKFEEYYKHARAVGLDVGVYWYSYAMNASDAKKEARVCLEAIKGKQFEYPVYIDMEDADHYKAERGMPSNDTLCDICEVFCEELEKAGYYAGIYASESWFNGKLKNVSKSYDKWLANWGDNDDLLENDELKTSYRIHQYTSMYKIGSKRFDRNVVYSFDYPKVIEEAGLNGFKKGSTPSKPTTPQGSTLDLAYEVMLGNYGSGDAREKALGSRYDEVQDFINHIDSASVDTLAKETKNGKYGNGNVRKVVLGDRYKAVQDKINAGTSSKSLKEGAKIKIKKGAKDMNTKTTFASFVYSGTYYVQDLGSDYVVFGPKVNGAATGKVKKTDVTVQ